MRNKSPYFLVVYLGLAAASPAHSQPLPNQLIGGQVKFAYTVGRGGPPWCYVTQGTSEIQLGGMPSTAVISFPELVYFDGSYHPLNGQARLTFTSSAAGSIKFKFWGTGSIADPTFSAYAQTFNGQQYLVSFTINFPGCALAIAGGYEAP